MIYLLLILGFGLLILGGDTLVRGSVKLAQKIGVSPLLIGLTLVGFGTSTPEMVTSLLAAFNGSNDIAVGNVVGSNTANILLVLGVSCLISPIKVDVKSFKRDSIFLTISTLMIVIAYFVGTIGRWFGLLLTGLLLYYVYYSYRSDKKSTETKKDISVDEQNKINAWISLVQAVVGIILTVLGAKFLVSSASELAKNWGITEQVIGLTVVAVGTSLPELITSIMSAVHKENDVSFGNVVGSNIFNALFVLGMTAVILPVPVSKTMGLDIDLMAIVTAILIGLAFWKKGFSRSVGGFFLLFYALYVYLMFF